MFQRYLKVFGVYLASSAISALVTGGFKSIRLGRWLTQTLIGYGIFAVGLKVMKRAKMDR